MRPHTFMLSALTLSTISLATLAIAAEPSKEGMSNGTFSAVGTSKATLIGKERLLYSFDANGLSLTNGFGDHMTWHCWGTGDFTNGTGQEQGYCIGTDGSGEQLVDIFSDDKHALDAKSYTGQDRWSGGSGKYAGVSGGGKYVCNEADFKAPTEGTGFIHCTVDWNYKLSDR